MIMEQIKENIRTMSRTASDNKYLHKDFHQSMNLLLSHIYNRYGKERLILYLQQYADAYYKIMKRKLQKGDLGVLVQYFTDIYEKEEWAVRIESGDGCLMIEQDACPAISHIRAMGNIPCPHYVETYRTVYTSLCKDTPFEYSLEYFEDQTGACKQIFKRKEGER